MSKYRIKSRDPLAINVVVCILQNWSQPRPVQVQLGHPGDEYLGKVNNSNRIDCIHAVQVHREHGERGQCRTYMILFCRGY